VGLVCRLRLKVLPIFSTDAVFRDTSLLMAAKQFICTEFDGNGNNSQPQDGGVSELGESTAPPALKKFRFLATKMSSREREQKPSANPDSIHTQLTAYITDMMENMPESGVLEYWQHQPKKLSRLSAVAEDLVSAPASQAYVERIFSVAGILSSGRRNRTRNALEVRVFLRLNNNIADW